jgi:putative hemolysin
MAERRIEPQTLIDGMPARRVATSEAGERHIIDELLDERAKTLRTVPYLGEFLRWAFDPLVEYRAAVSWADRVRPLAAQDGFDLLDRSLQLNVPAQGLEHVPKTGRALILANHPTGMVDGIAIYSALKAVRTDLSFFANRDAIRVAPRLETMIVPVEWLTERRSPERMRETLRALRHAFEEERAVVMFPAGGMATLRWGGLKELDWIPTTAKLLRRHEVPAIPLHIRALNTRLYYVFSAIHEELRDLTRFREMLKKRAQTFELQVGPALPLDELDDAPSILIRRLQDYVEYRLPRGLPLDTGN